jgi:replicative DNA helicase
VNLLIAKQRNGPAGEDVRLIFRKGLTRFEPASKIADEPQG